MSRRRLRVISSSSDEEDELPVRKLEHELPQEDDDDIEIELKEPTLNLETVTLNSSNRNPSNSELVHLEISDDEFVDVSDNLSSPSPPSSSHQPSISSESIEIPPKCAAPPSISSETAAPPSISTQSAAPPSISMKSASPLSPPSVASFPASRISSNNTSEPSVGSTLNNNVPSPSSSFRSRPPRSFPTQSVPPNAASSISAESIASFQASRISSSNTSEPSVASIRNVSSPSPSFSSPPTQSIPTQSIPPFTASTLSGVDTSQATDCPIDNSLRDLGLRLRRDWLDSCIRGLDSAVPGFSRLDNGAKAKLCFEQFLLSDMNHCGSGVLPENVHDMHLVDLQGPFVLQVDEIVNISSPLRGRYQNSNSGLKRCLKLSMTDGVQRVFGMEYRPIKDLEVLARAGLKVAICNVNVRRGLLMLVPEVFQVLGGHVEVLDAARQRLVNEVNKPPRGKRTRTGVVPPLATRATLAAWAPDRVFVPPHTGTTVPQVAVPSQPYVRGTSSDPSLSERVTEVSSVPIQRENAEPNPPSNVVRDADDVHMVDSVEELPSVLTVDREVPFTYLSALSAKWAAMEDKAPYVQGKIKCFLTGVKGFQFKQRPTYELWVYVDDGSLISEILIHHDVVQNMIGHSPREVTTALNSSDTKRIGDMKERLKQFQFFLANFEGMMVVEINGGPLPIAKEMNQGSSVSDAWLLLRRLTAQKPRRQLLDELEPINLSP